MRSAWLIALMMLGCAGAAPQPTYSRVDPERAELVHRLCAPLPPHAYDCVVGWPSSISPRHRDAVATAREGATWIAVPGVRAFASCADRPAEDGPVAHLMVLLVDTGVATAEEVALRLPMRVRWTEACEDETEGCASYYAVADGDRVVLTRRVQRPIGTELDVAHLACSAVVDGAEEARSMLESDDALVRELHVGESGITIVSRRPGGRLGVQEQRRTWTELDLQVNDDELESEATLRDAAMGQPIDPEVVDVTNITALDLQIQVRTRRLARAETRGEGEDATIPEYAALARLTERGFEAHPSRPDVAVVAVGASIQSHDFDRARRVLDALTETVGEDDTRVAGLGTVLDVVRGDAAELATRIARSAPELSGADAQHVAEALVTHVAAHPLDTHTAFAPLFDGVVAAARAQHVRFGPRAAVTIAPARGTPWTLVAAMDGTAPRTMVVCSDATLPTVLETRATASEARTTAFVALDHCAAMVRSYASRFELGTLADGLLSSAAGNVRVLVEMDGAFVGVGGTLGPGGLRVDASSRPLARTDFARIGREVVGPLAALGTRTFPPPTLAIPLPEARRDAAISATTGIDGVACGRSSSGVSCALESYEPVERLADAAYAIYAAQ